MARGWESKSVEAQIEEGSVAEMTTAETEAVEAERKRKRDSIEMSRRRVKHDLEATQSDVHRTALQNALAFLDAELKKLN
ncbi:MAG: hypothetical protein WBX15_09340 [Thermoanaerobaculia bacterium]